MDKKKNVRVKKAVAHRCEDCLYYDWDEEYEEYLCRMSFDEDEIVSLSYRGGECPYFRYYDEYKSVRRQI